MAVVAKKKRKISVGNRRVSDLEIENSNAKSETRYNALVAYKKERGHCLVPQGFSENPSLGNWVSTQRVNYKKLQESNKNGKPEMEWSSYMTKARFEKLNELGFVWDVEEATWEMNYNV